MKSTGSNAFFLLDDGRLYVIGVNNGGVFATRQNPRIMVDNNLLGLTKIVDHDLHGEKIVKFKLSENSLIFLTDGGHVFYSGMHSKFRPERFPVKEGTVKTIFATTDSVGVIDKEGRIGYLNDEIIANSEKKDGVFLSRDENLKNTIKIGGAYKLRYALVKNWFISWIEIIWNKKILLYQSLEYFLGCDELFQVLVDHFNPHFIFPFNVF